MYTNVPNFIGSPYNIGNHMRKNSRNTIQGQSPKIWYGLRRSIIDGILSVENMTIEEFIKLETQILTLDVEYLINNSNKTRNARRNAKKGIKRAPRPQNSFVIYRRNKNAELFNVKREERKRLPEFSEISKDIADSWSKESDDVKKFFKIMARMAERLHSIKYPYYKYQPGPIKTKQKKQKNNPSEETVDHVNINQPANLVDNLFFNDDLPSLMDQSYNYYGNLQESESEWDFNQFLNRDDCESQNY